MLLDYNKLYTICTNAGVYTIEYSYWSACFRITVTGLSVAACVLSLVQLKLMIRRQSSQKKSMRKSQEAAVTISLVVAVLCLTTVASKIAFVIISSLPSEQRQILGPNFRILEIINSSSNLFIYLWRSTEFRQGFLKKFCKKMRVTPQPQLQRMQLENVAENVITLASLQ
jgi:hypothetical protein